MKKVYPHLSVLKDSTLNLEDIKTTLGQDCQHLHKAIGYRIWGKSKSWAVLTKLGWMLSKPSLQQETAKIATGSLVAAEVDTLAQQVKTWWGIELYASNCCVSGRSKEDDKAVGMLKATTKFEGEKYEFGLLWKTQNRTFQTITAQHWVKWSPLSTVRKKIHKWGNGARRLLMWLCWKEVRENLGRSRTWKH